MKKRNREGILIFAVMLLLFFITLLIFTVHDAKIIQKELLEHVDLSYQRLLDGERELCEKEFSSYNEALCAYQAVMAQASDLSDAPYPYYSTSVIQLHDKADTVIRSKNMLVCHLFGESEDTWLPMTFYPENCAEAGNLLFQSLPSVSAHGSSAKSCNITGYWQDEFFIVTNITNSGKYTIFESPYALPDNAALISYYISATGKDYQYLTTKAVVKNYGKTDYRQTDIVSGWKKTDELTQQLLDCAANDFQYWGKKVLNHRLKPAPYIHDNYSPYMYRGSLITMRIVYHHGIVVSDILDSSNPWLSYAVELHPLALAFGQIATDGTLLLILLLYTVLGTALATLLSNLRKKELQRYQDEISRQTQALRFAEDAEKSRKEMTSAIAHELKTPIAVLSSYTEALEENIDPEKQPYYISVLREETEKMDHLVLELLDFSRLEAGRYKLDRQYFDLKELCMEILSPLQPMIAEKGIRITWQVYEVLIHADRYRFGQVVENFLTNAIRHTPEKGEIVIRIGMNHETLSVENQGRPIPQEQLSKVFDAFWQADSSRNGRGTGLGLAICKTIMQLHGGTCRVQNTATGVRFTANLAQDAVPEVTHRMPKEERIALTYPIAQEYTTVKSVMEHLSLLHGKYLLQEIRAHNITCGDMTIVSPKAKITPGQVLSWQEFDITITLENGAKRNALMVNGMSPGGGLGNLMNRNTTVGGGGH